jgi:hypothetical protein
MHKQKTASGAGRAEGRKGRSLEAERAFRNKITSPRPARATVSVYDGASFVGTLVERDGEYHAFDARGRRIGTFQNQRDALRAIPAGGES